MATLREILMASYGYRPGDFGTTGKFVLVDPDLGTIRPNLILGGRRSPAKIVHLDQLFRPGQQVSFTGRAGQAPSRMTIIEVQDDGVEAEAGGNAPEFLNWKALMHRLACPDRVSFD